MESTRPLCFVLMPFGNKKDPLSGLAIDFDRIYDAAIRPAIEKAGMEPIRADEERTGGIIHKAMFERLMLCDYAVADLTTANANVFYELGVRHAVRPATTLAIFAKQQQLPFDVDFLRALPYDLGRNHHFGASEAEGLQRDLARRLEDLRSLQASSEVMDSPVFQLIEDLQPPDVARLKTDVFRERARYATDVKNDLAGARAERDPGKIDGIRRSLGPIADVESGVVIDLFLSYRALESWQAMVELYEDMPPALQRTVMVREQLALALNRLGRRDEAVRILEGVLSEHGPSSETYGILGRVFKDRWTEARKEGKTFLAEGFLDQAIDSYRRGFEADFRDAYPGVNAVTLLDIRGGDEALALQAKLLPVVRFAVERRLESTRPDYWDHATLLELAVLADDPAEARKALGRALSHARESWEPRTTADNLRLIQEARAARGAETGWLVEIIEALEAS